MSTTVVVGGRGAITLVVGRDNGVTVLAGNPGPATIVEVGKVGPQGPPGQSALTGVFRHLQESPAALWTIAHNLGFTPNVSVEDIQGDDVIGAVTHVSNQVMTIEFSEPIAGSAYLS